jgi:hypothetical protein
MYNLEKEFKEFYKDHVVLPKDEKNNLFYKKNINIERLKKGLEEYNEEHGTDYKLTEEPIIQGSMAMSTIIQNDKKDYDIDVAIVFDKENIPEGTIATKNIIVTALKKKCTGFKKEPEARTNGVRIDYSEGYHVDFAIYRRYRDENGKFIYEHCGSEWRKRDPRAITQWFYKQNEEKDYKLRDVVRLLKMFSKSRDGWVNMPSGLILTVLADEQFQAYERMDERFYYTAKAIRDRLAIDKDVNNPVDEEQSLKLVSKDDIKINNLYNRLDEKLAKLDVLFNSNCTRIEALEAWRDFFNHNYWEELIKKESQKHESVKTHFSLTTNEEYYDYEDTEEFIEYYFPVKRQYNLIIDCKVTKNGKTIGFLSSILKRHKPLIPGYDLEFFVKATDVPQPYQIFWKVKNCGEEAKRRNQIRGQILMTNKPIQKEKTSFKGNHYVECYIIKDGVCVARNKIKVPIIS